MKFEIFPWLHIRCRTDTSVNDKEIDTTGDKMVGGISSTAVK